MACPGRPIAVASVVLEDICIWKDLPTISEGREATVPPTRAVRTKQLTTCRKRNYNIEILWIADQRFISHAGRSASERRMIRKRPPIRSPVRRYRYSHFRGGRSRQTPSGEPTDDLGRSHGRADQLPSITATTGRSASRRIDWVTLPNSALPTGDRFRPPSTIYRESTSVA